MALFIFTFLQALRIADSEEGQERRQRMWRLSTKFRQTLTDAGFIVLVIYGFLKGSVVFKLYVSEDVSLSDTVFDNWKLCSCIVITHVEDLLCLNNIRAKTEFPSPQLSLRMTGTTLVSSCWN